MRQKGMTLTSVLVAVALTSALAIAASKLVSNQAKLNKVMELTDQRDMITRFYSALMHNRVVWRCTVYDSSNDALRKCISNTAKCGSDVKLRTPDCKFKEGYSTADGMKGIEELRELTAVHRTGDHYRSSGVFFGTGNTITLGNSLTEPDSAGWWEVKLTAEGIAKGSVDLTLTINFKEDAYKTAHANFDPPDIRDNVEYRVRKGEPNIQGIEKDCANHAIVAIADLASGIRGITCSDDPLVNVQSSNARPGHGGKFFHSLADGSDARVGGHRTGLAHGGYVHTSHFAINEITPSGDYVLVKSNGKQGVLGFARGSYICGSGGVGEGTFIGSNLPALSEIDRFGKPKWTHHLGPQGKQGIPGPPGYKGPRGPRGPPATCPSMPPPCP